ncbi:MAG: MmcQ/YjbR family DNA-binding protein [Dehalococcoidia bacterium]
MKPDDPRARVVEICTALPEVNARDGQHIAFDVRGKRFAYYLDHHRGDGGLAVTCKAAAGVQGALVDSDPGRFFVPRYLGPRGWVALRLDVGEVDWDEVERLLTDAYRMTAPKRLAALVREP